MTSHVPFDPSAVVGRFIDGLHRIGYSDSLIERNYRFAVSTSPQNVMRVPVAAFGSQPPSYRTACLGLVLGERIDPESLSPFRDLGAPQVFAYDTHSERFSRWRIQASAPPTHLENIDPAEIEARLTRDRDAWGPAAVLRLKVAEAPPQPSQIDFFDAGLLPVLEREVQDKLDVLLSSVVAEARDEWLQTSAPLTAAHASSLFRIIFRFLAFKVLSDRGSELAAGIPLEDSRPVLSAVQQFYPDAGSAVTAIPPKAIVNLVWSRIRDGVRLENLSVEALAYVYENTMVSARQRRELGTHATPWRIADYIIRALPLESLPHGERTICEPFAGHAPFLVAAMGRLKSLWLDADVQRRHSYLTRMLSGIELDPFAAEVARYSLMLADYPASNGWRVEQRDVFLDQAVREQLRNSSVIVSNPPFEDFERTSRHALDSSYNKAISALRLFVDAGPRMLGLILPQAFIDGQLFRDLRNEIVRRYANTQLIWLPDIAFAHAGTETAVLIASQEASVRWKGRLSAKLSAAKYTEFERGDVATLQLQQVAATNSQSIWASPLANVWSRLATLPTVATVISDSSRGMQYRVPVRKAEHRVLSKTPRKGFRLGVFGTSGPGFEPYTVSPDQLAYLNIDPEIQLFLAYRKPWDQPKVLVNAQRKSRGMWPLVAIPDQEGLVAYQTVTAFWPSTLPVEVLAAVLNGPVVNAFVALHNAKRHLRKQTICSAPIPILSPLNVLRLTALVVEYRREATGEGRDSTRHSIVERIDEILLEAYGLPARLERELLLAFGGEARPGLTAWRGYYDDAVPPAVHWSVYRSAAFKAATAAHLRVSAEPFSDPTIGAALSHADISGELED